MEAIPIKKKFSNFWSFSVILSKSEYENPLYFSAVKLNRCLKTKGQ